MTNFVKQQFHLCGQQTSNEIVEWVFAGTQQNTLKVHTLTESRPDISCRAFWSVPGLEGESTFTVGRSIFWDSKELEPATKGKEKFEL